MIKKITLTVSFILTICSLTFGQDKFVYNQEGLNPKYVVVEVDSLKQSELFMKTINWIKESYKNPDEVIKTTIDNEKVRFEGFKDNLICINSLGMPYCYDGIYTIEIDFKDNKYKLTPLSVEYILPAARLSINFNDGMVYYNKKGKLRKAYETLPLSIEVLFNGLNSDLEKYILDQNEKNKKNDW